VDISTIIILAAALLVAAIGFAVGIRLVPIARRAKQDLAKIQSDQTDAVTPP
jgi:hypothetical protein